MAGQLTQYVENELLKISLGMASTVLGTSAPTNIPGTWLALYTVSPTDTTAGTEVAGSGYARRAITWATPTAGSVANAADIVFNPTGPWGTVTSFAACDSSGTGGGHALWFGDLQTIRTLVSGDTLTFFVGDLVFTMD
jgi:hypothetical protein